MSQQARIVWILLGLCVGEIALGQESVKRVKAMANPSSGINYDIEKMWSLAYCVNNHGCESLPATLGGGMVSCASTYCHEQLVRTVESVKATNPDVGMILPALKRQLQSLDH